MSSQSGAVIKIANNQQLGDNACFAKGFNKSAGDSTPTEVSPHPCHQTLQPGPPGINPVGNQGEIMRTTTRIGVVLAAIATALSLMSNSAQATTDSTIETMVDDMIVANPGARQISANAVRLANVASTGGRGDTEDTPAANMRILGIGTGTGIRQPNWVHHIPKVVTNPSHVFTAFPGEDLAAVCWITGDPWLGNNRWNLIIDWPQGAAVGYVSVVDLTHPSSTPCV